MSVFIRLKYIVFNEHKMNNPKNQNAYYNRFAVAKKSVEKYSILFDLFVANSVILKILHVTAKNKMLTKKFYPDKV